MSRKYFDKDGNPIEVGNNNIHEYKTEFDDKGRPKTVSSINLNGELVIDENSGYAIDVLSFDDKGRLVERKFLDAHSNLVNHQTWQVARIVYSYKNDSELSKVDCFNFIGEVKAPVWNPVH